MGKRKACDQEDGGNLRKRIQFVADPPTSEEIHTSRQLRLLLQFNQDLIKSIHGLRSFKRLLEDIGEEKGEFKPKRQILQAFLRDATPSDSDKTAVYLQDVMETWSYGAQKNNDTIMSAVPVLLALLLRILLHHLDSVPFALGVGRTLLQKRQLALISRNLSADKHKSFVLCPTLRMLREAITLDGGALSKAIFRHRLSTFRLLPRNMGIKWLEKGYEDHMKPSVRTNAVRFLLSALKFLPPEAKNELLSQKEMGFSLTKSIKDDPPALAVEIIEGLKQHVLRDTGVTRETKARFFVDRTLKAISSLYGTASDPETTDEANTVEEKVHDFLLLLCTNPSLGILRLQHGFYGQFDQDRLSTPDVDWSEMTWEQLSDLFSSAISVRNRTLSVFIQTLRPWSSTKQSELLTSIFGAAPELVAHYFRAKPYSFDPKLSATWMGYAAFLFNTVASPIPIYFGSRSGYSRLPPPTSYALDNILPPPLTRKALRACLADGSNLASFIAARILVAALEKLGRAVQLHREAADMYGHLWIEAAERLVDECSRRMPAIQDMVNTYRSIPDDDYLHREITSRLLRLYYEVVPQLGLDANLDVFPFLDRLIDRVEDMAAWDTKDRALALEEWEHLLTIAKDSTGMRWFSKVDKTATSPFTKFLRLYAKSADGPSLPKLLHVLNMVAEEKRIVVQHAGHAGLLALLESIRQLNEVPLSVAEPIWGFLDNCLCRCAAAHMKYWEFMLALTEAEPSSRTESSGGSRISLVTAAILEQLPFFVEVQAASEATLQALAKLLSAFIGRSVSLGEDKKLHRVVLQKMKDIFPPGSSANKAMKMAKSKKEQGDAAQSLMASTEPTNTETTTGDEQARSETLSGATSIETLQVPDSLVADNSALIRWVGKSTDDLVDEGYAIAIISLLASDHTSIRKEALTNILKIAAKLRQSEHEEKEQIWLMLSELAETAKGHVDVGPLPSALVAFACRAFEVLRNPLHCIYPRVNSFLIRGPVWALEQVPLVLSIVQEDPEVDESYYSQVGWLASYVVDCLRTPADVQRFHVARMFGALLERLQALSSIPYIRTPLRTQILRILYRVSGIEGGSTALTTRLGVVAWLRAQEAMCASQREAELCGALARRIVRTADQARIVPWAKGSKMVGGRRHRVAAA